MGTQPLHFRGSVKTEAFAANGHLNGKAFALESVVADYLSTSKLQGLHRFGAFYEGIKELAEERGVPCRKPDVGTALDKLGHKWVKAQNAVHYEINAARADGRLNGKVDLHFADFAAEADNARRTELNGRARAEAFDPRFKFTSAAALEYVLDDIFLVDDLLPSEGLAAFYGAPGCGKSFGSIDLSVCLGAGIPYAGKHTEQAYVIYVAAEGGKLFDNRVKAAIGQRGLKQKDVALEVIHAAPNLGKGDKDAKALIQAIKAQLNPAFAHLPFVVVIDTLARTMGGAPENDEGIGAFITNCGIIEKEFGGLVIAVHYTGKDPEKGLRGHSSLHGATDCEWFFSETDKGRSIQIAKFKDADEDIAWDFTLKQIEVGRSKKRGKPVTTCIADVINEPAKAENAKASGKPKKISRAQRTFDEAFNEATIASGGGETHYVGGDRRTQVKAVGVDQVRAEFSRRWSVSPDEDEGDARGRKRKRDKAISEAFRRILKELPPHYCTEEKGGVEYIWKLR